MRKSYIPTVAELDAFVACAQRGSTTLAAGHLNLTQSAISRSLASLEERLGVALFHRVRQRLVLSPAGQHFLPRAAELLDQLNAASVGVMAFGGHDAVLRISSLPTFGRTWLIPRLAAYQKIAPSVVFDISARLEPVDFDTEPFDLALMRIPHEGVANAYPVVTEYLVAVAAPDLAPVQADDGLPDLPLLQQSTRPTLWLDWFRDAQIDPRKALRGARMEHFDMVIDAAMAGLGIGIVPEVLALPALQSGDLRLASTRRMATGDAYGVVLPGRSLDRPDVVQFRDWLVDQGQTDRQTYLSSR